MTPREVLFLIVGIVLVSVGWGLGVVEERVDGGSAERAAARRSPPEDPVDFNATFAEARADRTPRALAPSDVAPDAAAEGGDGDPLPGEPEAGTALADPGGFTELDRSGPVEAPVAATTRPTTLPPDGIDVWVVGPDGETPAAGAPVALWVVGGDAPLASAFTRADGRVRLRAPGAVAARYEVGLASPGAERLGWPPDGSAAGSNDLHTTRMAPIVHLVLPPTGEVEVLVPGALDAAGGLAAVLDAEVALGLDADPFRPAVRANLDVGLSARFGWVPLGQRLAARVTIGGAVFAGSADGPGAPGATVRLTLESPETAAEQEQALPGGLAWVLADAAGEPLAGRAGWATAFGPGVDAPQRWRVLFRTDALGRTRLALPPGEQPPARLRLSIVGPKNLSAEVLDVVELAATVEDGADVDLGEVRVR